MIKTNFYDISIKMGWVKKYVYDALLGFNITN
jgi:hypothetical protein